MLVEGFLSAFCQQTLIFSTLYSVIILYNYAKCHNILDQCNFYSPVKSYRKFLICLTEFSCLHEYNLYLVLLILFPYQMLDTLQHDSETHKTYMETQCEDLEVGLEKFLDIIEHKLVIPCFSKQMTDTQNTLTRR